MEKRRKYDREFKQMVVDLYYRKIIGWSFSSSLKAPLTIIPALMMAISNRPNYSKVNFSF